MGSWKWQLRKIKILLMSSVSGIVVRGTKRHTLREKATRRHRTKMALCRPGEGPQETPTLLTPWSRTSSLQHHEERNMCCLSHSECGACYGSLSRHPTPPSLTSFRVRTGPKGNKVRAGGKDLEDLDAGLRGEFHLIGPGGSEG